MEATNSSGLEMSEELLRQYIDGALGSKEQHFVERNLLESELWTDVYEGMQAMQASSVDARSVHKRLSARVQERIGKEVSKPKPTFQLRRWLTGAAAVIGMVAVAGGTMKYLNSQISESATANNSGPNFNFDEDAIEVIQLKEYNSNNTYKQNSLPIKSVEASELPLELQYERGEVENKVASLKQLPSGNTQIKTAQIDQDILSYNGYRQVIGYQSAWRGASGPNPPEPPRPRQQYIAEAEATDGFLAEASSVGSSVNGVAVEQQPSVAAAPTPADPEPLEDWQKIARGRAVEPPSSNETEVTTAEEYSEADLANTDEIDSQAPTEQVEYSNTTRQERKAKAKRQAGISAQVYAANTISGTITDADGEPIIGATVRIVGTDLATTTDENGDYTLKGVNEGDDVTVSYVGMDTITAKAKLTDENYFILESNNPDLGEVVVTGYGKQGTKSDLKRKLENYLQAEASKFLSQQNLNNEGRVVLEVTLTETGTVSASKIIKGISPVYDIEAERLVKKAAQRGYFNNWAAIGKPIRVRVKFKN